MRRVTTSSVLLSALVIANIGCSQFQFADSGGACNMTDSSGNASTVNTYSPLAKWKMTEGYNPPLAPAALAYDFDVLIIEPGEYVCEPTVVNQATGNTLFSGTYSLDVVNKKININYTQGSLAGTTRSATYSFSGSCSTTQMNLAYTDGTSETYQYYNASAVGDCGISSTSSATGN